MSAYIRTLISIFLLACFMLVTRLATAETFLPPDQAFVFSAKMRDGGHAQVTFNIAPNYYMYRKDFVVTVVSPDGKVTQNGELNLPTAQSKYDENFNKNMAVYHGLVQFDVPVKGEGMYKLVVTSRGCADGGLCYPPRKTQAVLTAHNSELSEPLKKTVPANSSEDVEVSSSEQKIKLASKPEGIEKSQSNNMSAKTVTSETKSDGSELNTNAAVISTENIKNTVSNNDKNNSVSYASASSADNSAYARDLFSNRNIFIALGLMFGLGVLLSLTPCMLPMVPILSSILAGQQDVSRRCGFFLALSYVTGMALVYSLIGVLAAKTGASLQLYLQSPWVLGVFAGLLLLLALSLFDVFQLKLPTGWQEWLNNKTQGKNGFFGVALMGAASALIASPCVTAPLVGVITYIAQTGNVVLGSLALFVLAYGMGLPLLLLGAGLGQFLPKSGAWMGRIKQLIGLIMVIAALWVAQPLWDKYWQNAWGDKQSAIIFQPVESIAELNKVVINSNKPVLLDLYADWCRSCIEMEKKTFPDPRVKERLSKMTLVRVDMTAYTNDDADLLAHFDLYGPPAILILEPLTGKEKMRVVGFEGADRFIQSLDEAGSLGR